MMSRRVLDLVVKQKDGSGFPLGIAFGMPTTLKRQLRYIKKQVKRDCLVEVTIWEGGE